MMIRSLIIVVLFVAVNTLAEHIDIDKEWEAFKLKYSKKYTNHAEEQRRLNTFKENFEIIIKHNQLYDKNEALFKMAMAINKFADLTNREFTAFLNTQNTPKIRNKLIFRTKLNDLKSEDLTKSSKFIIPKSFDWRQLGAVTAIKNQGSSCSSCWAFAAMGALESHHFLKTGQLISLSEQNLIDYLTSYGNHGCDYGWAFKAFEYIKGNHGIESDLTYPYTGVKNQCKYNSTHSVAIDYGFIAIPNNDEHKLKEAVATIGPIAVQIDARQLSFQHYADGVYFEPQCSSVISNHAVLVVGYGTDERDNDFFIVKNSWGKDWGENGYIKMIRNHNNSCGISTFGIYPIV